MYIIRESYIRLKFCSLMSLCDTNTIVISRRFRIPKFILFVVHIAMNVCFFPISFMAFQQFFVFILNVVVVEADADVTSTSYNRRWVGRVESLWIESILSISLRRRDKRNISIELNKQSIHQLYSKLFFWLFYWLCSYSGIIVSVNSVPHSRKTGIPNRN